jgi:hypothetical protein
MRDEAAQQAGLPGDRLTNSALVGFINRNYGHDERGCWYFQNGPQRVYINLEATPYIARTDPAEGLLLQTGAPLHAIDALFFTETGEAIVQGGDVIAQLDDRDGAQLIEALRLDGAPASGDALLGWLDGEPGNMRLDYRGRLAPVERVARDSVAQRFGFVRAPAP